MKNRVSVLIGLILVSMMLVGGCVKTPVQPASQPEPTTPIILKGPKVKLASYYTTEEISVLPNTPSYNLPLDLSQITNYDTISSNFNLGEGESLLRKNGFVVIDYYKTDDIVQPYKSMKERGIPIFVTSDTLLHLYHIQFNEILMGVEEREFFDNIKAMSEVMMDESADQYNSLDGDLREAARRNTAYFAVGLKLLDPNADIPSFVRNDVDKEMEKIEAHKGFEKSVIFRYKEDYSQYVPRGHYTRSENLKKYFKAMMWHGRMSFLLKGCDTCFISEEDAKIQTIQASLITTSLDNVNVNEKTTAEMWDRIYAVTAYFVGLADDLTPYEYKDSIQSVFGSSFQITELSDGDRLLNLKAELATLRLPRIYGGTGECYIDPPITQEKVDKCLGDTQGMRFMGQRFIPDSYMFQNLITLEYTGNEQPFTRVMTLGGPIRGFPRGLDVMALLGSKRAKEILEKDGDTEYKGYDEKFNNLSIEFDSFNETHWNRNLYWSWLYTLKALLKEYGEGYPTFMQTKAWQEKELQTALASWAELRHDTILYAKQSYSPGITSVPPQPKPVVGYVEPVPEFYSRILALTKMTDDGLTDMNVLNQTEKDRLQSLESILTRLIQITKDELENKELTDEDYEFIRNFGDRLDAVVAGVDTEGKETTVVADVHTDINTGQVLEEGVGYVDLILVAYKVPDGRILVGAGPVMSYYEFKWPMDDRLTDEKWKEMLQEGTVPEKPDWANNFAFD